MYCENHSVRISSGQASESFLFFVLFIVFLIKIKHGGKFIDYRGTEWFHTGLYYIPVSSLFLYCAVNAQMQLLADQMAAYAMYICAAYKTFEFFVCFCKMSVFIPGNACLFTC